jgi:hypothetical protein
MRRKQELQTVGVWRCYLGAAEKFAVREFRGRPVGERPFREEFEAACMVAIKPDARGGRA